MPKITPISHNILGKALPKEETTEGGIFIPEQSRHEQFGRIQVLNIGPEVDNCKEGDIVMIDVANIGLLIPASSKENRLVIFSKNIIIGLYELNKDQDLN